MHACAPHAASTGEKGSGLIPRRVGREEASSSGKASKPDKEATAGAGARRECARGDKVMAAGRALCAEGDIRMRKHTARGGGGGGGAREDQGSQNVLQYLT